MAEKWSAKGKNFLVTGGATGLGGAQVELFLKFGAEKVAILDIAEDKGKEFTNTLNQVYNDKVIFIKCDVSKEAEIEKSFQEVLAAFGRIDVIINNAGIMNDTAEVWRTACDVNWQGLVSFTLKGIKHMRKDEGGAGGTIINVSSLVAFVKVDILPIYSGSKAAVLHFGRCLSSPEFNEGTGIRVLTIAYGPTATPLLDNIPERAFDLEVYKQTRAGSPPYIPQSVKSASDAVLKMFNEGEPGSIWYSGDDEPGKDITSHVDKAFLPLQNLLLPGSSEGSE